MRLHSKICTLLILLSAVVAHAALTTPVTVSSITVSGTVATVTTATPHSIPNVAGGNTGFCILGVVTQTVDNVCGAAATIPSTTTYTFNFPNGITILACAASCGTGQPATLFVIKGNSLNCQLGKQCVTFCEFNFAAVPVPISGATTSCASAFTVSAFGANAVTILAQVNAALVSGQFIEISHPAEKFASTLNSAQLQAELQNIQLADQNANGAANSLGGFIGKACDATGCN